MSRFRWAWPSVIIVSLIGAGAVVFVRPESPMRLILTWWFLLMCPGMAFVRLLSLKEWAIEWSLAIALSIAIDMLVNDLLAYREMWQPERGFVAIAGLSISGVILQVLQTRDMQRTLARGVGQEEFSLGQYERILLWLVGILVRDQGFKQRLRAVRLYGGGRTFQETRAITGCSRRELSRWCEHYRAAGIGGLRHARP